MGWSTDPSAIGLIKMHIRPKKGRQLTVLMRDGTQLKDCHATMVYIGFRAGIVIYHNRRAIDESLALGWWPARALRRLL